MAERGQRGHSNGADDPASVLALLVTDPSAIERVPAASVPALLGALEQVRSALWLRLTCAAAPGSSMTEDRLLTVQEAAARLGMSPDWVYRQADRLPFTRRTGRRTLRFSAEGLRRYLAAGGAS